MNALNQTAGSFTHVFHKGFLLRKRKSFAVHQVFSPNVLCSFTEYYQLRKTLPCSLTNFSLANIFFLFFLRDFFFFFWSWILVGRKCWISSVHRFGGLGLEFHGNGEGEASTRLWKHKGGLWKWSCIYIYTYISSDWVYQHPKPDKW